MPPFVPKPGAIMNKQGCDHIIDRLRDHRRSGAPRHMRKAYAKDPNRFARCSAGLGDFFLDWSKCAVNEQTIELLIELAHAAALVRKRDAMFAGAIVNTTEQRPALHIALRNRSDRPIYVDGKNVMPQINGVLSHMRQFSDAVRSGAIAGSKGDRFTDIVNIGIGGSDLGPAMAAAALAPYHTGPRLHFVSNIDGAQISDTIRPLDPSRTLIIVASKTFTTTETMTNAATARNWIKAALGEAAVGHHFVAVSTALDKISAFGISSERSFGFWDWVGGRYSIWSAIGLPVMIAVGADEFESFLAGGHIIDEHFRTAPLHMNLPAILGLIGFWHRDICNYTSRAVIPYDQRLMLLPAYLQQLDMESNGKRVTLDGSIAQLPTGPVVWGEPGTNGQHAFFQFLHQGTDIVPVEFLIAATSHQPDLPQHHDLLIANCLAQSEALMVGRTLGEATAALLKSGSTPLEAKRLAPHKVFPGNRPSITLAYRKLDPRTLGMLIALFEHRTFVEACLWNINPFDQWGVELGKEMATALLPAVQEHAAADGTSPATLGLLSQLNKLRKPS
jgi:glucose-6-phosphate isomerase